MNVEIYHSPHCTACESLIEKWVGHARIRRVNVCTHLEAAAALGISRPPALVIDGRLVAQGADVASALQDLGDAVHEP